MLPIAYLVSIAIDACRKESIGGAQEDHGGVLKKITSFCPPDRTEYKERLTCSSIFDQPDCLKVGDRLKGTTRGILCRRREEEGERGRESEVRTGSEGRSGGEAGRRNDTYVDRSMYV